VCSEGPIEYEWDQMRGDDQVIREDVWLGGDLHELAEIGITPLLPSDVADVLAHTDIVEGQEGDLIAGPECAWVVARDVFARDRVAHEFVLDVPEDQFWRLVTLFGGQDFAEELRHDLDDMLRWESEGGSCVS